MHPWHGANGDDISSSSPSAPPQPPSFPSQMSVSSGGYDQHQHQHRHQMNGIIPTNSKTRNRPPHAAASKTPSVSLVPWSSGLCNCCDDLSSCCLTCWCPCIAFGRIAEIADRGSTSCGVSGALYMLIWSVTGGCACLYSCFYRSKLRGQYFLKEQPCSDCCVHCCCEVCALCQEYRQLKHLGFDMSIGWHGNVERRNQGASEPPLVPYQMKR